MAETKKKETAAILPVANELSKLTDYVNQTVGLAVQEAVKAYSGEVAQLRGMCTRLLEIEDKLKEDHKAIEEKLKGVDIALESSKTIAEGVAEVRAKVTAQNKALTVFGESIGITDLANAKDEWAREASREPFTLSRRTF